MAIKAIPSGWKTNLRTGAIADRDLRLYADFRQFEYPDLGTGSAQYTVAREENLIDRGNCELGIAPMIFGETVPVLGNCTFERSSDFSHTGDFSYKITKTIAAGTNAFAFLTDTLVGGDLHGYVSGSTYICTAWYYVPTASGIDATEAELHYRTLSVGNITADTATELDKWQELTFTFTIPDNNTDAQMPAIYFASTAADTEYFYVGDIKITTHNIPGSHFLSGGFIETLNEMPDTFTAQWRFLPTFAFDTASLQYLDSWYVSATQELRVYYDPADDKFKVLWEDGGTARTLESAQYDAGSAERNINQVITLTLAFDSTTGDTTGSSLWLDKTQDDTAWDDAIDAKTTVFNKNQIRALNGTAGAFNIFYKRQFNNLIATDAQVQNDFKDVGAEEIYWSLDGHGTGRTRVNISRPSARSLEHYDLYKGVTGKLNQSYGTNTLNLRLRNDGGRFSDDQNAAWDPANQVYNGTNAQNYLTNRFGVMTESWFEGDFDYLFIGRATEDGFRRQPKMKTVSTVSLSAEDGVGDLDRTVEEFGRVFPGEMLTREDTIMDHGSCESLTPPAMRGEESSTLSNATFERTADEVYIGRFSYVGTKTIAAGTAATIALSDNIGAGDMHNMIAGAEYTWRIRLKLPSGAMLGTEFVLAIVDSAGSTTQAAVNTFDAYQEVKVTRTLDGGATFAYPQIQLASAAANNELFYIDLISFEPADQSEATDNSLFHSIAKRGYRRQIQYAANNSFENTTIGDTWLVTAGGTLNKDGADGFFGSASAELIPGAAEESMFGDILFTGTKKLNVGETYTWQVFVKSAGAASGANNSIAIAERDSGGGNDTAEQTYTLAGGEGYKAVNVQHTITDSDSDRLRISVKADAGDTINIDAVQLIQSDRALDYFEEARLSNGDDYDGLAGVAFADLGKEISWPWFGIHTGNVDYIHPWRRMEINTTIWQNTKSIGAGTGARYCGFDENNTLINFSILDSDYGDLVPAGIVTDSFADVNNIIHHGLTVRLDELQANRLYGVGVKYQLGTIERLIWLASGTGNFTESVVDQQLTEVVPNQFFWPLIAIYPEYWSEYGAVPEFNVADDLTIVPNSVSWRTAQGVSSNTFAIALQVANPEILKKIIVSKRDRVVGVQSAKLMHKTVGAAGSGDGDFSYVSSGRIVSGLDITSRAGQAQILLFNNTGDPGTLIDAGIVGLPVYKFSGSEGHIHDSYIDRDDIAKNGEKLIQFGGEDVISGEADGQLDRLADFIWKDRTSRKHIYVGTSTGALHDISPAAWMHIDIGAAGTAEDILGTANVLGVRISADDDTRGKTNVTYRELTEGWKYDSNVNARFFARGVPVNKSTGGGAFVTVGSEFLHADTDLKVPIGDTSAEDIIIAGFDFLIDAYGGGELHLTKGIFEIDGPITIPENIKFTGEGDQTIINAPNSINMITATSKDNIEIRDMKLTMTGARTGNPEAIALTTCDNIVIDNVTIDCDGLAAIDAGGGADGTFSSIRISGGFENGAIISGNRNQLSNIWVTGESGTIVTHGLNISGAQTHANNITVKDIIKTSGGTCTGITFSGSESELNNCYISNVTGASAAITIIMGLQFSGDRMSATNCTIDDTDNTSDATLAHGLRVFGDNNSLVGVTVLNGSGKGIVMVAGATNTVINECTAMDNGADTGIDNTNGDNFSDAGTNTFVG